MTVKIVTYTLTKNGKEIDSNYEPQFSREKMMGLVSFQDESMEGEFYTNIEWKEKSRRLFIEKIESDFKTVFHEARAEHVLSSSLDKEKKEVLYAVRSHVRQEQGMIVQKILPPSDRDDISYEQEAKDVVKKARVIKNFVARYQDVMFLNSSESIIEGTALKYWYHDKQGIRTGAGPFLRNDGTQLVNRVYALRFRAMQGHDRNLYKTPFGAPTGLDEEAAKQVWEGIGEDPKFIISSFPPFAGNGFTENENMAIPEYKLEPQEVDGIPIELYRIDENGETLVAVGNSGAQTFAYAKRNE